MSRSAIALRAPLRALTRRRGRSPGRRRVSAHARRRMLATAVLVMLAAAGWMWLRDSPLVAVNDVQVTGLTGADAASVRNALADAARDMSTLHVRMDRLRTAVSPYPVVKDLRVETDFPHGMRIEVVEHDAVAAVEIHGRRVPVAGDGTLLRGRPAATRLVTLSVPAANGGGRLTSRRGLAAVAIMGAAPKALRPFVTDVTQGPDGLRVTLTNGPLLQFGDASRARAKWLATARVLADPRAAGASYLDVRAPERPVAGRFDDPSESPVLDGATDETAATEEAAGTRASPATEGEESTATDEGDAATTDPQAGVETGGTLDEG